MSQNSSSCNRLMGIILIALPFIALIFGSDEPAMQTDNAALVMTGMIFFGIILLASSGKKSQVSTTSQPYMSTQSYDSSTSYSDGSTSGMDSPTPTRGGSYCPYCGTSIAVSGARFCPGCGASLDGT